MSRDSDAPPFHLWAREALEIPGLLASPFMPPRHISAGHGRPVIVLPGFLAGDISTIRLRRSLQAAGYAAYGWEQGQNRGARIDLLDRICAHADRIAHRHGQAVALVGWSLGGVFAREVAKLRPEVFALVVTLGSPFSGDLRANNAWRLYEWLNDHPVDKPPFDVDLAVKPPVPCFAVWSSIDGIVSPRSARGQSGETDGAFEVACRHFAFAWTSEGIRAVGCILANHWPAAD